jgi:SAM-dependent methyltransferase
MNICCTKGVSSLFRQRLNIWKYWRPIYRWTWAKAQESSYQHAAEWLKGKKATVLDVGTGTGEYIALLPQENHYIFTDIDEGSLKKATRRAMDRLGWGFEVKKLSAMEALEQHQDLDVILMVHVISVIGNHEALIRKAMECLKPGGSLLIYINRFSRKFASMDHPIFQGFGFKLINVDQIDVGHVRTQVGLLNECYDFRKETSAHD